MQEKKKGKFSNIWKGFTFKKINTNVKENNELKNDGENNEESESKSCELKDNKDKKAYAKKLKRKAKEEKKRKKAEKKKKKKENAKKKAGTKKKKERGDDDNEKLKNEKKEDQKVKEKNNNKKINKKKEDKKQKKLKKEEKRAAKEKKKNATETEPVPGPSNLGHNRDEEESNYFCDPASKRVVKRKDKQDRRSLSIKLKNAFKKRSSKVMIANDNNGESQVTFEDSEDSDESQTKIECRNKIVHSKEDNSYQEHHKIIIVNCIDEDGPTIDRNQT
eukprot:gene11737-12957_t